MTDCGIKFSASLLHPRYWLTWLGLFITFLIAQLPTKVRHSIGRFVGKTMYNKNKLRSHIVRVNLQTAFPDQDEATREAMILKQMQWYSCALIDYSLLFFAGKKRLAKMVHIDGREHIDQAIKQQKNVMILLAHSAMLEFAPIALSLHYDCFGSYKSSKNALFDWLIARSRCRHVKFVVSREQGMRKLIKSMVHKRLMIFLPDEDLGLDNAVFAPFFNTDKATLTTTARIAKMGKAVALPTFAWFDPATQKYVITVAAAIPNYPTGKPEEDARALNQALQAMIEQHPEQYMWNMKWFRTRPENQAEIY